jgi:predicted nucleic acid-binding protein
MKIIVCNTGPILHLKEIGLLDLLKKAGRIIIPKLVDSERSEIDPLWRDQKPSWILVEKLPTSEDSKVNALCGSELLDIGEAEAIILAQCLKADWFLIDDTSARTFANLIGLEVHGTLGLVLWAAATGYLKYDEAKEALKRLSRSSLWISQTILEKANKALDEMSG